MLSQKRHILYVDDDLDSCEMIVLLLHLEDERYFVTAVSSAEKALNSIGNRNFDLYILDYALPGMSGVELCRRIRQTDSQTPILFYSAMGREIDLKSAQTAGANDYLIKPNDLDKLSEKISNLLNKTFDDSESAFSTVNEQLESVK